MVSKRLVDAVELDEGVLTIVTYYVICSPLCVKSVDLYDMMLWYCTKKGARMTNGEMRAVA
jgi:hypothetical protein